MSFYYLGEVLKNQVTRNSPSECLLIISWGQYKGDCIAQPPPVMVHSSIHNLLIVAFPDFWLPVMAEAEADVDMLNLDDRSSLNKTKVNYFF